MVFRICDSYWEQCLTHIVNNVYTLWCGENQIKFNAGEPGTASNLSKHLPQKHDPRNDC